jgi:HAMP domain-containing protein/HPt (histidine-containing phosphotransfer) domain-containing protein
MTIRQRISLLIVLVFAALAIVGGFAVVQARQSATQVRSVTEGVVPSAMQSMALMTQLKDVQIATLNMVAASDAASVEQTRKDLAARKSDLQAALAAQLKSADSPAQVGLIKQAQESLQNYFSSIDDTARFKLAGNKDLAEASLGGTVDQYLREQGEVMQTLQVEKNRSKDAAIAALNAGMVRTQSTLSIVTVAAVIVLCFIGLMLYRQIVRPVAEMQRKMTEIANSQDFTLRVPVTRDDEIGRSMTAFNAMVEKIQESTELVRQKTADIHSMMHAIPQGVMTLEVGGRIHPEYSAHLSAILETDQIAGRPVMEVVFDGVTLGSDELSQVDTAIGACIGEDEMNFEFNAHLLPAEIEKTLPSGKTKVLDLNWSPMSDAAGTMTRLLLCVRDVTELRELARAADAQKRELAIIGEILGVTHEKFHEFCEAALAFFDENARMIARASAATEPERVEALALLFRNMHTIKGNARTHGLVQLTNVIHHIEETYDHLRHGVEAWDTERLTRELEQGRAVLQEYAQINEVKLGRQGPGRRGAVDKFVMVPRDHLSRLLATLQSADANVAGSLEHAVNETIHALHRVGTERLAETLSGVLESLPSLEDRGVLMRSQIGGTLRNVFMHLYRNALDHGIETPERRLAAGKPAEGRIELDASLDSGLLKLVMRDDGRGLALGRLRAKALANGLIDEDESLEAVDIANLIFAPGFSTADKVTQVSGRGVGMDAVRGFIEAEGGAIELELEAADAAVDCEHAAFRVVITLPGKFAVARERAASERAVA